MRRTGRATGAAGIVAGILAGLGAPAGADGPLQIGGSNYPFYEVGEPGQAFPDEDDGRLRPVIGTYHLDPGRVEHQLREMFYRGQRQIALVLWFDTMPEGEPDHIQRHCVELIGDGRLADRHEANLRAVVELVAEVGYETLYFRFAPQGGTEAHRHWDRWEEDLYRANWNFIRRARAIVERAAGGRLRVVYDIGLEQGGLQTKQAPAYQRRLWGDYVAAFGPGDTCGFSVSVAPGRIARLMRIYREVGAFPPLHAVDIYKSDSDEFQQLRLVAEEFRREAGPGAPDDFVVMECFYNDPIANGYLRRAALELDLDLVAFLQWPIRREHSGTMRISGDYPANYSAYLVGATGTLSATAPVPVRGKPGRFSTTITWETHNAPSAAILLRDEGALFASGAGGRQDAPWIQGDGQTFDLRRTADPSSPVLDSVRVEVPVPPEEPVSRGAPAGSPRRPLRSRPRPGPRPGPRRAGRTGPPRASGARRRSPRGSPGRRGPG